MITNFGDELGDIRTGPAAADPEDQDGDGISGRVNMVWDVVQGKCPLTFADLDATFERVQATGAEVTLRPRDTRFNRSAPRSSCRSTSARAPCRRPPTGSNI